MTDKERIDWLEQRARILREAIDRAKNGPEREERKERTTMTDTDKAFTDDELKMAINNFLWSYLPGSTSIRRADSIACDFFDRIKATWDDSCRAFELNDFDEEEDK